FSTRRSSDLNASQVDGLASPKPVQIPTGLGVAHGFTEATGAAIGQGGNEAAFIPSLDRIVMPPFGASESGAKYYGVLLHELGHWSGHTTRLNRNLTGRFGTHAYAAEE